jgi:hypothetical protein
MDLLMFEPHQGYVQLSHDFKEAWSYLRKKGTLNLETSAGTAFVAKAGITRDGRQVIKYYQGRTEYGRSYECCWDHYYNCNRTRIGMFIIATEQG